MSNQMMAEVHAMLTAQFKAASMIVVIDGWTLFQNSEAGPYVGLYNSRRNHREGRVYVNDWNGNGQSIEFKKLPAYLRDEVVRMLAQEQPAEAPRSEGREAVEEKRFLRGCQPFKVIRYKYAAADENDKEPWRIERCFPIGNSAPRPEASRPQEPATAGHRAQPEKQKMPAAEAEKAGILSTLWTLVPEVYGSAWNKEVSKVIIGISQGKQEDAEKMTVEDARHLLKFVELEAKGRRKYGQDWYTKFNQFAEYFKKPNVYEISYEQLKEIYERMPA